MAEQVDTLPVDIELGGQHFDQVVQEVWPILGNSPALRCERIWSGEDDAFFPGQRCPGIEKRLAVATGTMQQDDEGRRAGLLGRLGNQQVIGSCFTAGAERFLRRLVGTRNGRRQQKRQTAGKEGGAKVEHAREYTPNRQENADEAPRRQSDATES